EAGFALNRVILDACRRRGFQPIIAARSSQIDFIVELVATGLGIGFLPRMIAEQRRHPAVRQVLLAEPQTEWHMAMIWRRGSYLSYAARAWLALAREAQDPQPSVIPAKAGIQGERQASEREAPDSRFRGNDER